MNIDVNAIVPVIEGIAQKLGVAAEHLWGVLIRQAINDGISDLLISIILGISTFVGYKLMKWSFRKDKNDNYVIDDEVILPIIAIFGGIALFVLLIVCVCYFSSSIKHFINPEYYAFIDIVSRFK